MHLYARPDGRAAGVIAALVLLAGLHLALFAFATLVTDSGRDLANAWAIGHDGPYPEYGPSLFGRWKLGPVWFFALALPLRLWGSVTAAALFTGAIAAMKIPLAFLVGRRMLDARLGLLMALAISLPGWSSVGTLVIAHTSAVETAVLATFWLALAAWQDRRPALLALGAGALALHAHPTALIAAPALLPAACRALRTRAHWLWLALGAVLFVLPFVPALLAEMRAGWPQAAASLGYLQEADSAARLARLPQIAWALVTGGAWFGGRFLLPLPAALVWLLHGLLLLAASGGAFLLFSTPSGEAARRARRWLLALGGYAGFALLFLALLRDVTPSWMTYALAPLGAALLALAGWGLLHDRAHRDAALAALSLVAVGAAALGLAQRIGLEAEGRILLPGASVGDVAASRALPAQFSPWLSVRQFDALAREACAEVEPVTLHGELAAVFDFSQGVAARLHCPPHNLPQLGGAAGSRHLAGVPAGLARELGFGMEPVRFGQVLREPLRTLTRDGRLAEVDVRYRPERQALFDAAGDRVLEGHAICPDGALLVLTNLTPLLNRAQIEVWIDGQSATALADTRIARYYDCGGGEVAWRVLTPDPAAIDAVLLARGGR